MGAFAWGGSTYIPQGTGPFVSDMPINQVQYIWSGTSGKHDGGISLNLSNGNSTYSGTTVQVPSLQALACIKT